MKPLIVIVAVSSVLIDASFALRTGSAREQKTTVSNESWLVVWSH